eukprot:gnl/Chilomastix_cuspidata/8975.p1 GENE.gnl/Chilomastix_cuspidata/8975~~gnl/Chilomastix_cuspidata/8975.p1  ORF type:complete len:1047 (-),score=102.86 gnl/Chilomastix_cuspidata/8975:782-3922(-)
MRKKLYLMILFFILAICLAACSSGGSGGGNSGDNEYKSISGAVIDDYIVGATVYLKCGDTLYSSTAKTDNKGGFIIEKIPADADLSNCILTTSGGSDASDDFNDLVLKSPIAMFDDNNSIYITPFTTLVANHGDMGSSYDKSIEEVAGFLGLTKDNLSANPLNEVSLARLAKKITKVALLKDNQSKLLGFAYIDLSDKTKITQNKFDDFVKKDISGIISESDMALLEDLFTVIDQAEDLDNINFLSIIHNVKTLLYGVYGIDKEESYFTQYQENMSYLAEKIAQALKQEDNKYKKPDRYVIRKALSDLDLSVSYNDQGELEEALLKKITAATDTFKEDVDAKVLDIKNVEGVFLFDVEKDKKILGDDNEKRLEYYTFSNISHMGKAIEIAETSYDDQVLDPTYKEVAQGYLKLGFYEEALELANNNIYSDSIRIEALNYIASILVENDENELAEEAVSLSFESFKEYAKTVGKENLEESDIDNAVDIFYVYYKVSQKAKAGEVLNYLGDSVSTSILSYNKFIKAYHELMQEAVIDKKKEEVKDLFAEVYSYALNIPSLESLEKDYEKSAVVEKVFFLADIAAIINEFDKGQALIDKIKSIYPKAFDSNERTNFLMPELAFKSMKSKEKLDEVLTEFPNLTDENKADVLRYGLVVAMVLNSQTDTAIKHLTTYYPNAGSPYMNPTIFPHYVDKIQVGYNLDSALKLGFVDKEKQEDFLYKLFTDSKDTSKAAWERKNPYYQLFNHYGMKETGYPVLIRHFTKNQNSEKADEVAAYAVSVIKNDMSLVSDQIAAYQLLFNVLSEVEYNNAQVLDNITAEIKTVIPSISLDNSSYSYSTKVRNLVTSIQNLGKYNKLETAKLISDKIIESLPEIDAVNPDLDSIKTKLEVVAGRYITDTDYFEESLTSALLASRQTDEAVKQIDIMAQDIDKVEDSLDKNQYLSSLAKCYAAIASKEKALAIIDKISTVKEKNDTKLIVSKYLANYDCFPSSDVASVDSDSDGKPDFFSKFASQEEIEESGLTLDDDIDNDGISDSVDELPYDNVAGAI